MGRIASGAPVAHATEHLRQRVLDAWTASPARFREDANAEEDARTGYRDRLVVELAQNAVDAGGSSLLLRLDGDTLVAANTGAALSAEGVEALSTLRASAKRSGESVGRYGVGFAAVLAVTDAPMIGSRGMPSVRWSAARTAELVAGIPPLAGELARR
ncbi:MAG: sacsin N-terminal ATP-binding-like domain-containing protein, partial [Mycobacteriales bacterium]